MQYYKGDPVEVKTDLVAKEINDQLSGQRTLFHEGCYTAQPLGGVICDSLRAPLANVIPRQVFIESFPEIFNAFILVGSFEAYLTVFRKIFGDDVQVTFTADNLNGIDPEDELGPGVLNIDIVASGVEVSPFIVRSIMDNAYVYDDIVDTEEDNIAFKTIRGLRSQYELERMLFEMVPAGIFTNITLTLGEEE